MSIAGHVRETSAGATGTRFFISRVPLQQTVEVTIQDYFLPAEVRIKAGDTVKWINMEKRTSHSVLFPAENGLESSGCFPQEHWQRTFVKPGRYRISLRPARGNEGSGPCRIAALAGLLRRPAAGLAHCRRRPSRRRRGRRN
jgi:plastocyanin